MSIQNKTAGGSLPYVTIVRFKKMGGTAYLIHGTLEQSRLDPVPRRKSLFDRLLGRQRYDKPTYSKSGSCTLIDDPSARLSRQIVSEFHKFLDKRIPDPWHATIKFLEYLQVGVIEVYLRGEESNGKCDTDWYVQLSFSDCGGITEISAKLAYHWAELWVQHDIQTINETILQPEGFTANPELESVDDPLIFVPVGFAEESVYSAVSFPSDKQTEFELDSSAEEWHDAGGGDFLDEIREEFSEMLADGKCRCQLCMPNYTPRCYAIGTGMLMDLRLEDLKIEILHKRNCGETTVAVKKTALPTTDITAHLDSFVSSLGFTEISDHWLEITEDDARSLLQLILTSDLAYGSKIMSADIADGFASRFLETFTSDCRYFTNGTFYKRENGVNFSSISDATLDTGVVCTDAATIGMIWVQDED